MSRIWRIVLMWLLAFAVPAQGIAAATMVHCGSADGGAGPAGLHAGHSHDGGLGLAVGLHHDSHDDATSAHSHGNADTASASHHDDLAAKASSVPKLSKTSCSVCASCCTAAALPSAIFSFEASAMHDGVVASLSR